MTINIDYHIESNLLTESLKQKILNTLNNLIKENALIIFHNDTDCTLWSFDMCLFDNIWAESITYNNELTVMNLIISSM